MEPEMQMLGSVRRSREDVWLSAYTAALTGLCTGVDADDIVLPRGPKDLPGQTIGDVKDAEERGKQRRRKIIGAAALLANRAVEEWSLHWPADTEPLDEVEAAPDIAVKPCGIHNSHKPHVWKCAGAPLEELYRCPGWR